MMSETFYLRVGLLYFKWLKFFVQCLGVDAVWLQISQKLLVVQPMTSTLVLVHAAQETWKHRLTQIYYTTKGVSSLGSYKLLKVKKHAT